MKQWQIAFRALLRRPGYSLTAILMLVLGIGATTTLFSVVDTILLKPLPYPNPDRLVTVMEASPSKNKKESLIAPGQLGGLEPAEPDLRGDLRQLHRKRHRYQRRGAGTPGGKARLSAIFRRLRRRAADRPDVHEGRGNRRRSGGGGDQLWTVDAALRTEHRRYRQAPGARRQEATRLSA